MSGRVLNFLEFSDKYSNGSNEPLGMDDLANASSNFEEGFDDETYDQPQIGPNRPISGEYEMTPSIPGEEGSSAFSAENTEEMNAPSEDETETSDENEPTEEPEESSEENEPAEEPEDEEGDDEDEDKDEHEEGNPEAGANPKKKVEEGFTMIKGFAQFINENYGDYPGYDYDDEDEEERYEHESDECPKCGEVPISNEYGTSCGCNM